MRKLSKKKKIVIGGLLLTVCCLLLAWQVPQIKEILGVEEEKVMAKPIVKVTAHPSG